MKIVEPAYSDSELLCGIYERNDRVISAIIQMMKPVVKRLVLAKGGRKEDVLFVIEEAIVIIYTKTEMPVLSCTFKTFFIGIAKRVWFNEFRRRLRQPSHVEIGDVDFPVEDSNSEIFNQRRQLVLKHFDQLPQYCQDVLRMMAFGYSNEDIMERMGFSSVQYNKNRKMACNNRLIEILKKDPLFAELMFAD